MTFYNIYLNCPLCGQLYSAISYPKYEDGMVICTCTAETVHNERVQRKSVHNERPVHNEREISFGPFGNSEW